VNGIKDLIFNTNNLKTKLFDHSFILTKLNKNYIRLETYIWDTYKEDLRELFFNQEKLKTCKQLFDVERDQHFSKDKVRIVINN